eukprot:13110-Heterococcus_DN1.PRE.2
MAVAAVVQMALVGRRAYMSRQNSVLGLGKIDHTNDNDDNDSIVDTVPTVAAATAATAALDKFETVEHGGTTPDRSEQQQVQQQSSMRF